MHIAIFCPLLMLGLTAMAQKDAPRKIINFDKNWLFLQRDVEGAEQMNFDDGSWQKINVPHDWSILGTTDSANATGRGGGYLPAGIGWYRKYFTLDSNKTGKRVFIDFDGVMANSDVWINGFHLGKRPYGYSSFEYELTGHLHFGKRQRNVIAVRADNSVQPASRYYTGAGIYRHVRLKLTSPVHIAHWGAFVSTPLVTAQQAVVQVTTKVVNESDMDSRIQIQTRLVGPDGKMGPVYESKAQPIGAGKSVKFLQEIAVAHPARWNLEHPNLYKAISVIKSSQALDEKVTVFGIRSIAFTADSGFLLNGKKVMIKGVCMHHDGGAVGAAVPLGIWERRLKSLKSIGVNGIRTSHNPVAPEFLDLCDRMGFLVMDENLDTWEADKVHGKGGYQTFFKQWVLIDTRDEIMRDRNHPSIVIYSVGNEIRDNLNSPAGFQKYLDLQGVCHRYDSTRPVTMALFRPGSSKVYTSGFAELMDVVGQNYRENELVAAHNAHPDWKVIGTENGHSRQAWLALRDHRYMAGQFLWVGFDYLGEAKWPEVINGLGLFDHTGYPKPIALQRASWWSSNPVVHLVRTTENGKGVIADWTPHDPANYENAQVLVYTNCDSAELFSNGKSLGIKSKNADDAPIVWPVKFEKGEIKVIGVNQNHQVASESYKTASKPERIILKADKPVIKDNWNDLSIITATVVDHNGTVCPGAQNLITYQVTGAGFIAATDNGDTRHQPPYRSHVRASFNGRSIAIIKANTDSGRIKVSVSSPGLKGSSLTVLVK